MQVTRTTVQSDAVPVPRFINRHTMFILLFLLGGIAVVLALVSTQHGGVGTTPDSVNYITASKTLLAGYGYVRYEATPFTIWPPVYPTILAGVNSIRSLLGLPDIVEGIRFYHALLLGVVVVTAGWLYRRSLGDSFYALIATGFVLTSFALLRDAVFAWNELSFLFISMVFVLAMARFLQRPGPGLLFIITVLAGLAAMLRYAGVGIIPAGAIMILCCASQTPLRRRIVYMLFFGLSAVPYVLWYLYNRQSSTPVREQANPLDSLATNLHLTGSLLNEWFLPEPLRSDLSGLLLGLLIVGATVMLLIVYGRRWRAAAGDQPYLPLVMAIYLLVYMVTFYTAHVLISTTPVDHRHLSVMYVYIVFVLFWAGQYLARRFAPRHGGLIVLALAAIWLLYPVSKQAAEVAYFARTCCDARTFRPDPMIEWLNANPLAGHAYSNTLMPTLYTDMLQFRVPIRAEQFADGSFALDTTVPLYLIWFDDVRNYLGPSRYSFEMPFTVAELEQVVELELVTENDAGRIYRIHQK